jgi:VanZ family protein
LKTLFAILFFLLLGTLLALTYYPNLPELKVRVRDEWFRLDYIGHLGFYAAVTASFLLWRAGWRNKPNKKLVLFTIIGGLILGAATEFSQLGIHGRSFNPFDLMYNCIGIFAGIIVVYFLGIKTRKINSPLV